MCTTPKSSKAAKPKNRPSATNPDSYRNNLAAMQAASNHFDEFDRDAEQFKHLTQNANKAKNGPLDSDEASAKSPAKQSKHAAQATSWMEQFRKFWQRHF